MPLKDRLLVQLPINDNAITVRPFVAKDLTDTYVGWLNDAEVVRFSNQRFISHSKSSCEAFYRSFEHTSACFLAVDHEELGMIGTMTVYFNEHHGTADIGILIGERRVWGQGIGLAAWCMIMEALKGVEGLRKITGGTLSCNLSMMSIFRRAGMIEDGIRYGQEVVAGVPYDIHHFAYFIHE
ncbi:MAG: GNAT family N-acetyltransferase [Thalassobium sp.]|jgi:RimJ/RimL family protein N-acetyltransferase|uniref:GNAT family N-acetyltransferase n=1 Tax=Thalassolituus oleivorans TaxID=187493 RepID=UPI000BC518F3|nr:GNAT family N-acetyltransferase [Thalassolituus oleivorans]MBQ0726651.1 GNAT family N-acetyltransferase [Thalassolituus oleivorans]MBQ0780980.1 GNAT family N-acetyltransferase [Thalassolituus oleivorans]PCI50781.1 MAG: GNAT family N-acetyltransferase [Oceanospirillales bacterium]PHQ88017.1 MAG: GNAT family N-acetyltransferase [Thalassobium sp.]